ncbi:MAG TPA: ester cyclase [Thermoleophilaceae bacterium]|nr:ester cyclase [Thermoleophilaceae bacterium]
MSSSEANEAAVRDCFENASKGNFEALPSIVTADYLVHPEEVRGPDGLAEMVQSYRSALAGLNVTVEHQFSEGDHVATRCTIRGRHDGELMGVPPTGRDVEFTSLTISRCRDGKIAEEWELIDTVGVMRQIGALPELAGA